MLSRIERAWVKAARDTLMHCIHRVAPPTVCATGLRGWLLVIERALFDSGKLEHDALLWRGWRVRLSPQTLGSRFARAGLAAPHDYIMAMRVAAIGALLAEGADIRGVEIALRVSSRPALYRAIGNVERRSGRAARTASILNAMRNEAAAFAFARYVEPLLPTSRAKWNVSLTHPTGR